MAEYPYLLPNLMLGVHPSYLFAFGVQPTVPDRTLDLAFAMMETSRLSCQIPFTAELDRLRMKLGAE